MKIVDSQSTDIFCIISPHCHILTHLHHHKHTHQHSDEEYGLHCPDKSSWEVGECIKEKVGMDR